MKFGRVKEKVKGIPFIGDSNAKVLYDFIIKNKPKMVLELGIAHGTASCYIAAALDEIGEGKLVSVDLLDVKDYFNPSIEKQLTDLNLNHYVEIHRMKSGYNWFLHDEIKSCSENKDKTCIPKYDLIIIDGPKNWTIDSSSFFLSDKLLKENGWIIWDDYNWTYADANASRSATDGISHRSFSEVELTIPHIREIFHLLVMQHPDYGDFIIQDEGDWVWAKKIRQEIKTIQYTSSTPIAHIIRRILIKTVKKITMHNKHSSGMAGGLLIGLFPRIKFLLL